MILSDDANVGSLALDNPRVLGDSVLGGRSNMHDANTGHLVKVWLLVPEMDREM